MYPHPHPNGRIQHIHQWRTELEGSQERADGPERAGRHVHELGVHDGAGGGAAGEGEFAKTIVPTGMEGVAGGEEIENLEEETRLGLLAYGLEGLVGPVG